MSAYEGQAVVRQTLPEDRVLTPFGRRAVDRSLNPMPNIRLIRRQ